MWRSVVVALVVVGCGPAVRIVEDTESAGDSGEGEEDGSTVYHRDPSAPLSVGTVSGDPVTTAPPDPSTSVADATGSSSSGSDCGDAEGMGGPCTPFEDDCPPCFKCSAWDDDGGSTWNANNCFPVDLDPDAPGEPCTVEGSGTSGFDSCDATSMCWNVDIETNTGVCQAFCTGTPRSPICGEDETCLIANDGVLNLCLPVCDPLAPDCPPSQLCLAGDVGVAPFCIPGHPKGLQGDPCAFSYSCDPGLYCADAADVPGCTVGSCCELLCDLDGPPTCTGAGQTCLPWFADDPPPSVAHLGRCGIP